MRRPETEIIDVRNSIRVDKDDLAELQRRERALREALKTIVAAWPSKSLLPAPIVIKVAAALNNTKP